MAEKFCFQLVPYQEGHLDDLVQLEETASSDLTQPWDREMFIQFLEGRTAHIWMAQIGRAVIGLVAFEKQGNEWVVQNVVVSPNYRRRRVGSHMMAILSQWLAEPAMSVSALTAFLGEKNLPAQKFFEKAGFRTVEPETEIEDSAVKMQLELSQLRHVTHR